MRMVALIMCLLLPSWGWADNYLCIADETTGFAKRDGRYQQTDFTPNKYVVNSEAKTVSAFGIEGNYMSGCDVTSETVLCKEIYADFLMHRQKMKFMLYVKSYGYVWETIEDSPHIAIGTCSQF